jgi:hypothetical protein
VEGNAEFIIQGSEANFLNDSDKQGLLQAFFYFRQNIIFNLQTTEEILKNGHPGADVQKTDILGSLILRNILQNQ